MATSSSSRSGRPATTVVLLRAAQEGDRKALNDLLARYYARVLKIATLRLGHRLRGFADPEDVLQETMIIAARTIHRFEERSEGCLLNWLARIAENVIRDLKRKGEAQKRGAGKVRHLEDYAGSGSTADPGIAASDPGPSSLARAHEVEDLREEAMRRLSSRHREVIILRLHCGMSFEEIARAMGFGSAGTARSLHFAASHKLRSMLHGIETETARRLESTARSRSE